MIDGTIDASHASWAPVSSANPAGRAQATGTVATKLATPTWIQRSPRRTSSGPPLSPWQAVCVVVPAPIMNGAFHTTGPDHPLKMPAICVSLSSGVSTRDSAPLGCSWPSIVDAAPGIGAGSHGDPTCTVGTPAAGNVRPTTARS